MEKKIDKFNYIVKNYISPIGLFLMFIFGLLLLIVAKDIEYKFWGFLYVVLSSRGTC